MQANLGGEGCAELAHRMLRGVATKLEADWIGPRRIAAAPDTSHPVFQKIAREQGFTLEAQQGADLGERMGNALAGGISRYGAAAVIGADIPHLPSDVLRLANACLRRGDEVVGPSEDGGFYLLGLWQWDPRLFSGIHWGEGNVLELLLRNAGRLGRCFERLPVMRDIDHFRDLEWLARRDSDYLGFTEPGDCAGDNGEWHV
jgi:rSAM/selenodomain-associated transferase 1